MSSALKKSNAEDAEERRGDAENPLGRFGILRKHAYKILSVPLRTSASSALKKSNAEDAKGRGGEVESRKKPLA